MDDLELELKTCFLEEAAQHLEDTEKCFLVLERERSNPEVIEQIFRLAHNLKGAARTAGFGHIAEFTHELESLLQKFRSGQMSISDEAVGLLLESNDFLRLAIEALRQDFDAKIEHGDLLQKIKDLAAGKAGTAPALKPAVTVEEAQVEAVRPKVEKPAAVSEKRRGSSNEESIRVSLGRLERLNNFAGELVIVQAILEQQASQIPSESVRKAISQLNKITKEIQSLATACRMVPLKQTFQKLQRIARDTSITLGKLVDLKIEGEDTEVDKTVIEHLSDPLMHIIRNSVDHGLEAPAKRLEAGKPERGNIRLRAYHKGSHLVCEIEDDGRGLDDEAILKRARETGLISDSDELSPAEIHDLVFQPGFSTKTEASEISGRGVGLDVVRKSIERLAGQVWLETEKGKGTKFRILFPLTLAITEGMVVMCGRHRFIVLLSQVFETVRLEGSRIETITGRAAVLNLRGETIPVFRLNELLRLPARSEPSSEALALVINDNKHKFAVVVDEVVRQQQIVMKQMGLEIRNQQGFLGSSILGDGKASLILDLQELVKGARTGGSHHHGYGPAPREAA